MKTVISNISVLTGIVPEGVLRKEGSEMSETGTLENAWVLVEDGLISDFGTGPAPAADTVLDARGGMVLPSFCDSHTHLVYAGSRDGEFLDKINGLSYEEIAARGGGILNSADLLGHFRRRALPPGFGEGPRGHRQGNGRSRNQERLWPVG